MPVKLSGADLNAFMTDKEVWKDGYWWDDAYVTVNGQQDDLELTFEGDEVLPADAKVLVEAECFYTGPEINSTHFSFETIVRKWLKSRTTETLMVDVPKDESAEFKLWVKAKGWKVNEV